MQDYLQQVRDRLTSYRNLFQKELTELELAQILATEEKLAKTAIAIAVFGMVSRGKSSLINALLGQNLSETGAVHGITKDITVYEWEAGDKVQLSLIDTQGIDEVGGDIRGQKALEAARQADLILFVIAGDMLRIEQEAIANLQQFYKPILLVFNKTDLYPDCDRNIIHQSLQNAEVRKFISPQEIVLTSAKPKPVKVRIQYGDGTSQEIWEQPQPNIQSLQQQILDLLNREGKELMAINGLRSLLEIQNAVTQRYIQKLQTSTALVALAFITEAMGLLLSPSPWLDALISGSCSSILVIWAIGKYPSRQKYRWLFVIFAIAVGLGELGLNSQVRRYLQILGAGLSIWLLFKGLITDLDRSRASGKLGAKTLIAEIVGSVPANSILKRFN
jgi:small GTP-binding protein